MVKQKVRRTLLFRKHFIFDQSRMCFIPLKEQNLCSEDLKWNPLSIKIKEYLKTEMHIYNRISTEDPHSSIICQNQQNFEIKSFKNLIFTATHKLQVWNRWQSPTNSETKKGKLSSGIHTKSTMQFQNMFNAAG